MSRESLLSVDIRHLLTRCPHGKSLGRPAVHIPTEVCENIIDMLYSDIFIFDTRENIATLYNCALVCRAWRVRSQRMLFYRVQLSDSLSFHRLSTILDAGQHLRGYVREVQLTGFHLHNTTSIFAPFLPVFARRLPNVKRVEVIHLPEATETSLARTPPPKSKSLPYIPLHPRFPAFLSSFTAALSVLALSHTTFHSFTEFARMLRGLQNLEHLGCSSVRWIAAGGSSADFTKPPDWAASGRTLPLFAPKLRSLSLRDVPAYGAERLILSRGPHLNFLNLTVPLASDGSPEEPFSGSRPIDLSSCTGLDIFQLFIAPKFSIGTHAEFVKGLLRSWKPPQRSPSGLAFYPYYEWNFTRREFADILKGLGAITETWLSQAVAESPAGAGVSTKVYHIRRCVEVSIHDREDKREWWSDHLDACFRTWAIYACFGDAHDRTTPELADVVQAETLFQYRPALGGTDVYTPKTEGLMYGADLTAVPPDRWDVINEPFNDDVTWCETIWYNSLNISYIPLSLHAAHRADPRVKVYTNEYNTTGPGPKTSMLKALVCSLKATGVPLHGVGVQAHESVGQVPPLVDMTLKRNPGGVRGARGLVRDHGARRAGRPTSAEQGGAGAAEMGL